MWQKCDINDLDDSNYKHTKSFLKMNFFETIFYSQAAWPYFVSYCCVNFLLNEIHYWNQILFLKMET